MMAIEGVGAKLEVPSQICAALGPKQCFLAQMALTSLTLQNGCFVGVKEAFSVANHNYMLCRSTTLKVAK